MDIQIIRPISHDLSKITTEIQSDQWETLENDYQIDNLKKFVANPDNFLLLAYLDDQIAGMLEAYNLQKPDSRDKEMFLYSLETKPKFRQLGVAKALMVKLKELAEELGSHEIWVLTDEANLAANRLYSSLGIKTLKSDQVMYNYPLV